MPRASFNDVKLRGNVFRISTQVGAGCSGGCRSSRRCDRQGTERTARRFSRLIIVGGEYGGARDLTASTFSRRHAHILQIRFSPL